MVDSSAGRVPAIVLGRDATGLGALRCLQHAGIPAFVACPSGDLVTRSRWYRATPGANAWDGTIGATALQALREMPLEQAVLIPAADDAALWLADLPHEFGDRFYVSSSAHASLEILQDKTQFAAFMLRSGLPHPRTFTISQASDIDAIPFDELDRVFVKPANSQRFSQIIGAKGIWVDSPQQLHDVCGKLDGQGFKLMAQEYVPGTSADHYFVDGFRARDGTLTGLFARRRLRIFPPDFGNSSYCRSIPLSEAKGAVECVTELLAQLSYRGIFSAEFKRDSRDGSFRILEVNTRAWWYVEFAARCGVNVCEMAWQDALDMPVTVAPRDYSVGAGCVNFYGDIKTVLAQSAQTRGPLWKILSQWSKANFHIFQLSDPGPGLWYLGDLLKLTFRRWLRSK